MYDQMRWRKEIFVGVGSYSDVMTFFSFQSNCAVNPIIYYWMSQRWFVISNDLPMAPDSASISTSCWWACCCACYPAGGPRRRQPPALPSCSPPWAGGPPLQHPGPGDSIRVSRYLGITVLQYHRITVSQYHGITASQYHGITASQFQGITLSRYHGITV